jgi:hypothetical protein
MAKNRVMGKVLLAIGVAAVAGCATQPASEAVSLDEIYFQREAENYEKFQQDGETIYCATANTSGNALIPYTGNPRCLSERDLRLAVRDWRRDRQVAYR